MKIYARKITEILKFVKINVHKYVPSHPHIYGTFSGNNYNINISSIIAEHWHLAGSQVGSLEGSHSVCCAIVRRYTPIAFFMSVLFFLSFALSLVILVRITFRVIPCLLPKMSMADDSKYKISK